MQRTVQVMSKANAMALYHLAPDAYQIQAFDQGKYAWTGRAANYVGKEVPQVTDVEAVFPERRQDENGPYCVLRCVVRVKPRQKHQYMPTVGDQILTLQKEREWPDSLLIHLLADYHSHHAQHRHVVDYLVNRPS